ncbi:MAG: calcium-binding protein [Microcoleus sp.]
MTTLNNNANVRDLNDTGLGPDTIFAQAGADFIRTSTVGGSLIFGEADNDTIVSVGPNDTIYGGDNEDSIRSQATPALLFGDGGNDTIVAEAPATMRGGAGDDFLQGTAEANVIYGDDGVDILLGGAKGRDSLYGGKGNDSVGFFKAGGGNNLNLTLSGGSGGNEGSNLLRGDSGDDLVVGINIRDTLLGGKGNDTVQGVASSSYLSGDNGNDTLFVTNSTQTSQFGGNVVIIGIEKTTLLGGAGNDSLTGPIGEFGGGRNSLDGGEGNDTIRVFATQDTAQGGAGDDFIVSSTTVNVQLTSGAQSSLPGFAGRNLLDGGVGNDTIVGGFSTDTILGGDDTVPGIGNDNLSGLFSLASGGNGDDTISSIGVFSGTSTTSITLDGGLGNDLLVGNTNPAVAASPNNVTITNIMNGGAGNDTVIFGSARDSLTGDAAGDDFIYSSTSASGFTATGTNKSITDFLGNNVIFGANGNDSISTGSGNDVLFGGPFGLPETGGNDTLISGGGNDTLVGGIGNDYLSGGDGDDSLFGGPGADALIGGAGNDTFYYQNPGEGVSFVGGGAVPAGLNSGPDQIEQFIVGQDKLVFDSRGFTELFNTVLSEPRRLPSLSLLIKDPGLGEYVDQPGPIGASGLVVYESDTGRLLYDRDGIGGARAVHLATIVNKPSLSPNDITVI